jgi:hypothetical protein
MIKKVKIEKKSPGCCVARVFPPVCCSPRFGATKLQCSAFCRRFAVASCALPPPGCGKLAVSRRFGVAPVLPPPVPVAACVNAHQHSSFRNQTNEVDSCGFVDER